MGTIHYLPAQPVYDCYVYTLAGKCAEKSEFDLPRPRCEEWSRALGRLYVVYCVPVDPTKPPLWLVAGRPTQAPDWAFSAELP